MSQNVDVGDFVTILPFGPVTEKRKGICRFIGETEFAPEVWVGVEVVGSVGKNSGVVKDKEYFKCLENQGVFVRPELVEPFAEAAAPAFDIQLRADFEECKDNLAAANEKVAALEQRLDDQALDLEILEEEKIALESDLKKFEGAASLATGSMDAAAEIEGLREALEASKAEVARLETSVSDLKEEAAARASADDDLEVMTEQNLILEEKAELLQSRLDTITKERDDLNGLITMMEMELEAQGQDAKRANEDLVAKEISFEEEKGKLSSQIERMRTVYEELAASKAQEETDASRRAQVLQASVEQSRTSGEQLTHLRIAAKVALEGIKLRDAATAVGDQLTDLLPTCEGDATFLMGINDLELVTKTLQMLSAAALEGQNGKMGSIQNLDLALTSTALAMLTENQRSVSISTGGLTGVSLTGCREMRQATGSLLKHFIDDSFSNAMQATLKVLRDAFKNDSVAAASWEPLADSCLMALGILNDKLDFLSQAGSSIEGLVEKSKAASERLSALVRSAQDGAKGIDITEALLMTAKTTLTILHPIANVAETLRREKLDAERGFIESVDLASVEERVKAAVENPAQNQSTEGLLFGSVLEADVGGSSAEALLERMSGAVQRTWSEEKKQSLPPADALTSLLLKRAGEIRDSQSAALEISGIAADTPAAPAVDAAEVVELKTALEALQMEKWQLSMENKALEPTRKEIAALKEEISDMKLSHEDEIEQVTEDYETAFKQQERDNDELRTQIRRLQQAAASSSLSPMSQLEHRRLVLSIENLRAQMGSRTTLLPVAAPEVPEETAVVQDARNRLGRSSVMSKCAVMSFDNPQNCLDSCGRMYISRFR